MVVKAIMKGNETIELKPGCYYVTLQKPYETEIKGQEVIRFPFTVNGIVGKIKPFYFYLFKAKIGDDKLKVQRFNTLAMAIRKCFDVVSPFTESNYELWTGKKGRVVIGKHENGKVGVIFFMHNEKLSNIRKTLIENMHTIEFE